MFHLASFLGAFLLFLVQPLMAKQILPWFGGGSVVWASCLLFFQAALVGGYLYAHVTRRLGLTRQVWLHLALLGVALLTLPIAPSASWKPPDGSAPLSRVLAVLSSSVGFPYILLAATAPMVQDWFARVFPNRSPYRLYVVSNIGSLSALAAYPFLVERHLPLHTQAVAWSVAFAVFAGVCGWCARLTRGLATSASSDALAMDAPVAVMDRVLWIALPAIGSGLLVSTTNALTQDVAAVPLLWIAPLSIYLLTFIVAFAGWYWRWVWGTALVILLAVAVPLVNRNSTAPILVQGTILLAAFLAATMVCHGELAALRPLPKHLTSFYLGISIGGSLGAAFVAVAAPMLFDSYVELPLLFLLAVGAFFGPTCRDLAREHARVAAAIFVAGLAAIGTAGAFVLRPTATEGLVATGRSFYGVLTVGDEGPPAHRARKLWHGRILHGVQYLTPESLNRIATSYYVPDSGIALAITQHPKRSRSEPLKIGVMGLGSGTIAALAQPLDYLRFFELDELVVDLNKRHFTYLQHSPARISIVTGDGRLSLEREMVAEQNHHSYDILAMDAFSGDAIPVHLLTRESFQLYQLALRPDGILAVHVSNRYLDLKPVVRAGAAQLGWQTLDFEVASGGPYEAIGNTWLLVSANEAFLERVRPSAQTELDDTPTVVWTDAFSSLLSVWK